MEIAVIVPVLNRPERAAIVAASIREHERVQTDIVFVCSPDDDAEIAACVKTGERTLIAPWEGGRGDYARKINHALTLIEADWFFTGADDLRFTAGWDEAALRSARRGDAGVIGTADNCNPRTRGARHSTHSLVSARYAAEQGTVDARPAIYHEGYWHNFCDDELVATAIARRAYAPSDATVEHLHPMRGHAEIDDTYRLGLTHFHEDQRTFRGRRGLWGRARIRAGAA